MLVQNLRRLLQSLLDSLLLVKQAVRLLTALGIGIWLGTEAEPELELCKVLQ